MPITTDLGLLAHDAVLGPAAVAWVTPTELGRGQGVSHATRAVGCRPMDAREWLGLQPTHNPLRWFLPVVPGMLLPMRFPRRLDEPFLPTQFPDNIVGQGLADH